MKRIAPLAFVAVLCALLFAGCTAPRTAVTPHASVKSKSLLSQDGSVYVAVPRDGINEGKAYGNSGYMTSQIISNEFSRYVQDVTIGEDFEPRKKAMDSAREHGSRYLVYPQIITWDERATAWSGIPTSVEVKIDVFDVESGSLINGTNVFRKTGSAVFVSSRPQELLSEPVERAVYAFYSNEPFPEESSPEPQTLRRRK